MKSILSSLILISIILVSNPAKAQDLFPDGTPIPEWFRDTTPTDISALGKQYTITDYVVSRDSSLVQTKAIQAVIAKIAPSRNEPVQFVKVAAK